jgi:hypothetical protein
MKPKVKLTGNLEFPDTSDAFGRFYVTQGLEEWIVQFALCCWWYNWWSTQWPMDKFVSGFKEWSWMFEVARGRVGRIHMKLQVQ